MALRAIPLEPYAQHLFTSSQLPLPPHAGVADRDCAWDAVAGSLATVPGRLFRVRQVHGRGVRVIRDDNPASLDTTHVPDGDALVSNVAGATLAVVVADCVPVLLVDPVRGAAGAVHAGWRGTCAGVVSAAVAAMQEAWGTEPGHLLAALGPSIGPADYEVGDSLVEAFTQAGHGHRVNQWFAHAGATLRLDLWRANVDQLQTAGVAPDRIVTADVSTYAHPGWLESFRRDGPGAGRLVAAIVVPATRG